MAVTMILKKARNTAAEIAGPDRDADWVKFVAGGSLIAGACLLLTGRRRAGMVMAASGTALAMLEHEQNLRNLWNALPGYVDRAQSMFDQLRDVAEEIAEKGHSLRSAMARESKTTIPA